MKPIEEYHLWRSLDDTRRLARWLGIPGASFLPQASLVKWTLRELERLAGKK